MQLRKEIPLQVVVQLVQKLNLRYVLFTSKGCLLGMITRADIVHLMREHFTDVNALAEKTETLFDVYGRPTETAAQR